MNALCKICATNLCIGKGQYFPVIVIPIEDTNVNEGKGRFINRPTKTGKKSYDKFFIYIPTDLARDSLFPFKEGDEVFMKIHPKHKQLIIEKPKK